MPTYLWLILKMSALYIFFCEDPSGRDTRLKAV